MLVFQIAVQSLAGDILLFPYRALKFLGRLLIKILLLPYYLIKFLLRGIAKLISWLLPDFYEENLIQSFKGLFSTFKFAFLVLTFLLLGVLLLLHLVPLGLAGLLESKIPYQFDPLQSLILLVKTFAISEILIVALTLGGFLLTFLLAFVFISTYSPLHVFVEFMSELTESRIVFVLLFLLALMVFGITYLIILGKIPV
jgi:hypothetical protein